MLTSGNQVLSRFPLMEEGSVACSRHAAFSWFRPVASVYILSAPRVPLTRSPRYACFPASFVSAPHAALRRAGTCWIVPTFARFVFSHSAYP